jgi:hypothetical protein
MIIKNINCIEFILNKTEIKEISCNNKDIKNYMKKKNYFLINK